MVSPKRVSDAIRYRGVPTRQARDEDEDVDVCGSANEKLWKLGFISVLFSTVNAFFFFFLLFWERGIG